MGQPVLIPGKAIDPSGADIAPPLRSLLQELQLLGTDQEIEQAGSFSTLFSGPPQSVALIESGATALSKWWSVALGGGVAAAWGSVVKFWDGEPADTRRAVVWAAAIATAALVLAIGWIVGSDVRGRSSAMVATISARARLAASFVESAQVSFVADAATETCNIIPLPKPLEVRYTTRPSTDEADWHAIALCSSVQGSLTFLLVKAAEQHWVDGGEISFVKP